MRLRLPRLRRRGGTMPHAPGGRDTQYAALSSGRYAEPIPGGYRCTTCGETHELEDELPQAKAANWLTMHHCTPEET